MSVLILRIKHIGPKRLWCDCVVHIPRPDIIYNQKQKSVSICEQCFTEKWPQYERAEKLTLIRTEYKLPTGESNSDVLSFVVV